MTDAGRVRQSGEVAKEQASVTASQAGQAGREVAGSAAEQAKTVVGEARHQAENAVRDLRRRVRDEGRGQTERLAGTVRRWADDLEGMAQSASGDSPARSAVVQAANRGRRAADYLEERGVDGLVGDLQGFARRRPGAFLGGAVLAGLVAGRLMKAGKAAHSDDGVARQVPETAEPVPPVGEPVRTELQEYPRVV
ncbi:MULTISPECIES: hypothetical protein [Streptomyces]|uniref:DUF3618 domain-containing protein n=1 Tax=Streptomyces sudanensis TaxID=436397 RepID=A0ABY4TCQ0_9ACTN|nr:MULTISPECIES: hypothetical protein [Streptomyces]MCP9956345.1 hypothetical protein [Streptomyces sudanensis]MCP9985550.1 hypothetical protein [Streptomyces sudanensis]MCQ0003038.1 hypothetical protein [Streptomyces sudanensis]URN14770.1 hypothetical protein MW084_01235 [Streptomyces sudanensis]